MEIFERADGKGKVIILADKYDSRILDDMVTYAAENNKKKHTWQKIYKQFYNQLPLF